MSHHNHRNGAEHVHEGRYILHKQQFFRLFDVRKGEVRITLCRPHSRKVFGAGEDSVFGHLFDKGFCQPRHGCRRSCECALTKDSARHGEIQQRSEKCIEAGGRQLSANDSGCLPKLERAATGGFAQRGQGSEKLLEPVSSATFLMHGYQPRHVAVLGKLCGEVNSLLEGFQVPLGQDNAAGTDNVEQFCGFTIRLGAGETQEEKLSDLFFQCETARILHFFTGCALSGLHSHPLINQLPSS